MLPESITFDGVSHRLCRNAVDRHPIASRRRTSRSTYPDRNQFQFVQIHAGICKFHRGNNIVTCSPVSWDGTFEVGLVFFPILYCDFDMQHAISTTVRCAEAKV